LNASVKPTKINLQEKNKDKARF